MMVGKKMNEKNTIKYDSLQKTELFNQMGP